MCLLTQFKLSVELPLSLSLLSSTVWLKDSKARISLETTQHYFYSSPKQLAVVAAALLTR